MGISFTHAAVKSLRIQIDRSLPNIGTSVFGNGTVELSVIDYAALNSVTDVTINYEEFYDDLSAQSAFIQAFDDESLGSKPVIEGVDIDSKINAIKLALTLHKVFSDEAFQIDDEQFKDIVGNNIKKVYSARRSNVIESDNLDPSKRFVEANLVRMAYAAIRGHHHQQSTAQELERQKTELQAEVDRLKGFEEQYEGLRQELQHKQSEFDTLIKQSNEKDSISEEMERQIEQLEQQEAISRDEIAELRSSIILANTQIQLKTSEIAALKVSSQKATKQKEDAESSLIVYRRQSGLAEAQVEELRRNLRRGQEEVSQLTAFNEELNKELSAKESELLRSQEASKGLERQYAGLEAERDDYFARLSTANEELDGAKAEIRQKVQNLAKLTQKLSHSHSKSTTQYQEDTASQRHDRYSTYLSDVNGLLRLGQKSAKKPIQDLYQAVAPDDQLFFSATQEDVKSSHLELFDKALKESDRGNLSHIHTENELSKLYYYAKSNGELPVDAEEGKSGTDYHAIAGSIHNIEAINLRWSEDDARFVFAVSGLDEDDFCNDILLKVNQLFGSYQNFIINQMRSTEDANLQIDAFGNALVGLVQQRYVAAFLIDKLSKESDISYARGYEVFMGRDPQAANIALEPQARKAFQKLLKDARDERKKLAQSLESLEQDIQFFKDKKADNLDKAAFYDSKIKELSDQISEKIKQYEKINQKLVNLHEFWDQPGQYNANKALIGQLTDVIEYDVEHFKAKAVQQTLSEIDTDEYSIEDLKKSYQTLQHLLFVYRDSLQNELSKIRYAQDSEVREEIKSSIKELDAQSQARYNEYMSNCRESLEEMKKQVAPELRKAYASQALRGVISAIGAKVASQRKQALEPLQTAYKAEKGSNGFNDYMLEKKHLFVLNLVKDQLLARIQQEDSDFDPKIDDYLKGAKVLKKGDFDYNTLDQLLSYAASALSSQAHVGEDLEDEVRSEDGRSNASSVDSEVLVSSQRAASSTNPPLPPLANSSDSEEEDVNFGSNFASRISAEHDIYGKSPIRGAGDF